MQGAPTTNLKVGRNHKPVQPGADTEQASASTTVSSAVDEPAHDVTPPTWTGKSIGEYEIGEQIGQGGNGQVYRARHRCLDLPVAVKILRRVESDDQAAVSRFRQEAMSSARLVHPNLVRATDAGILQQHLYLVTDLVEGMDLY